MPIPSNFARTLTAECEDDDAWQAIAALHEEGSPETFRLAEAASALLDLPEDPPEWEAQDYSIALDRKFSATV